MFNTEEFDDSASACAIDALAIISKRSTSTTLSFQELNNEEVDHLFSIIKSGEASRSDLEEASSLNVLWCGVVLILKSNTYFIGNDDIATLASNLPVHVQRFFGALFSTFEVLMGHQRKNSVYLVQSLIVCVGPDKNHVQAVMVQMIKDYRSMFSYAYMFNRRTGATPVSQVEEVVDYFNNIVKNKAIQDKQDKVPGSAAVVELPMLLDDDDDNDSYDRLMRSHTDNILAPSFGAPSVMPLRPVKLLSDDEHYGSDYQPAVASDLERDLTYKPYHPAKAEVDHNLALMTDDSMYSMDGGSILNSYYKYNGWNNAVEEDEDSDNDNFQAPVTAPTAVKRMTRMRQSINRSADGAEEPAKKSSKRRKSRTKSKRKGDSNALGNKLSPTSAGDGAITSRWTQRDSESHRAAGAGRSRENSFDVEDFPHQDKAAARNGRTNSAQAGQAHPSINVRGKLDSFSTQDDSEGEEGSSLEEDGDDESDFSNEPPVVAARQHHNTNSNTSSHNNRQSSSRHIAGAHPALAGPRGDSGDVQDFSEDEEDSQHLNDAYIPSGTARRAPVDIHSPSSVGSSIELSDKERNFPRTTNKREEQGSWRNVDDSRARNEAPRSDWAAAGKSVPSKKPRMRSVLSDDDSDPEPAAPAPAKPDLAHRYRNPLDASVEAGGLRAAFTEGEEQRQQPARAYRNPLDASIETVPGRLRDLGGKDDQPRTSRMGSGSRDEEDSTKVSARSVIKVPSASPAKPVRKTDSSSHWSSRERESAPVELVSDWDTQLSDEDPPLHVASSSRHPAPSSAHIAQHDRGQASSTAARARSVQPGAQAAPAAKERHETPAERAAAMEKLRQNVLRNKQAKEQAAAATNSNAAPAAASNTNHQRPLAAQPSMGQSAAPPVSILRKSVTFEDQQQLQSSLSNDVSREEEIPFQHVDASAADMVLYGSRQNSVQYSSLEFKDDDVAQSFSSEESLAKHPPQPQQNRSSIEVLPRDSSAPSRQSLPPLHSGPGPSSSPSNALPPSKPTFSRIPSDQLLSHPAHHSTGTTAAAATATTAVSSKLSQKPPEAAQSSASSSVQRSLSHLSLLSSAQKSKSLQNLPENYAPPPLSEFARSSGVILEGYLHKKAAGIMGMWQKRYFVFSESATSFAVLRIYSRAVVTAWGPVALGLRASIPIDAMEAVETVAAPSAKGKEFTIKFAQRSSGQGRLSSAGSDDGSVYSDAGASGDIKVTTLMADDPETRLLWVTTLSRALSFFLHQE